MLDISYTNKVLANASTVAYEGVTMAVSNTSLRKHHATLKQEVDALFEEINKEALKLDTVAKAAVILANVAEENTNQVLSAITGVINKALTVLFPHDTKSIEITKSMYGETIPHYTLSLKTQGGIARTFNQSGTGLAQVISFLFTACLIDSKNGRKVMVIDELLNGLHPDAKSIVSDLMLALTTRKNNPFQIICVEYGLDIGRQYEIKKGVSADGLAVAVPYVSEKGYYKDISK